jgi:hypothetical protein
MRLPLPVGGRISACVHKRHSGQCWFLREAESTCDSIAARAGRCGQGCTALKDGARVRLYSRPGNDLTERFPLIVSGLRR